MKCESNVNSLTNNIFDNLCSECKTFSEKNKKCKNYAISKTKPLSFEKKNNSQLRYYNSNAYLIAICWCFMKNIPMLKQFEFYS